MIVQLCSVYTLRYADVQDQLTVTQTELYFGYSGS